MEISPAPNLVINGENLVFGWWPLLTLTRAQAPTLRSPLRRLMFLRSRSPSYGEHDVSGLHVADSLLASSRRRSPFCRLRKHIPNERLEVNSNSPFCSCQLSPAVNSDDYLDRDGHPAFHHIHLSPVLGPVTLICKHD